MSFPTVKSDPWKKGKRLRRRHLLWPDDFWKRLVDKALADRCRDVSPACQVMIREMNSLLYGKEDT